MCINATIACAGTGTVRLNGQDRKGEHASGLTALTQLGSTQPNVVSGLGVVLVAEFAR